MIFLGWREESVGISKHVGFVDWYRHTMFKTLGNLRIPSTHNVR
jgi:hypothetical protein